jgi:arylsulfatase A-like enzyme
MKSFTRREFIRASATVAGSVALAAESVAPSAQPERRSPNIVFVFADQMRSQVLGCYGSRQVPTPHLDSLARDGVRFTHAISVYPVCSPFRAMLLTGRWPMANGVVSNDIGMRDDLPTIATVCRANGYDTGYIGKWHLEWDRDPYVPPERRQGFDYWAVRNCAHQYFDSFYCGDTPERTPLPGYEPEAQTDLAILYLREHSEKPFCLFVSWGPPHDPYVAPDSYMQRFPLEEVELRENVSEKVTVRDLLDTDPSPMNQHQTEARKTWRNRLDNDGPVREMLQGYYAATQNLDDCMGRLLAALDETGQAENTIVVFTSDHGDMLGSHRMGSKQMPHEEAISIPFLLRYPEHVPSGTTSDALLGPVDMMPTLLGLAGIATPSGLDGTDLFDAARGDAFADERDAIPIMKMVHGGNPWMANGVTEWRGVRTKRYTYARLLRSGPWVLYDNQEDPMQMRNLVGDPDYADLQERLDARTNEWLATMGDPDDSEVIRAFVQSRRPKRTGRKKKT